jgi:multiple sugar transport system substrate-binding protein
LLILLVVGSLVVLGGCKPAGGTTAAPTAAGTQPTPVVTEAASEPVKITIFVGFGTGEEVAQQEVHNQLAEQFNAAHPDIQVEFMTVPWEEHAAKFSTLLAGGMAPDLVMPIGVQGVAEFYDEWLDLRPYIEAENYDMSDFYGPTVEMHTYAEKVVGLPIGAYPSVVYYNEDLFDVAGVPYPPHEFGTADWTYDEVVEIAKLLTLDSAGNNANSPDFNWEETVQWGWDGWSWNPFKAVPAKFGGNPLGISADMRTAEMTDPAWVAGMQWIADTIWTWHIRATGEQASMFDTAGDPLASNAVAMWECFSWMAYDWPQWQETFNWDVAAIPAGPTGQIVAETNGDTFVIPKSSAHPDEAWEVAKWMLQPENVATLCESYGCIPARQSLGDAWISAMQAAYPGVDFQVFIDAIAYMDKSPNHEAWEPNYGKVWDATENAMSLVVTGENTDVQAVLGDLNTEVQGYLDEYWASH